VRINRIPECKSAFFYPSPFSCRPADAANDDGADDWASDGARIEADALLARQCAEALRPATKATHTELCNIWALYLVCSYTDRSRLAWVLNECLSALSAPSLPPDAC
jgi:hypothetical protein